MKLLRHIRHWFWNLLTLSDKPPRKEPESLLPRLLPRGGSATAPPKAKVDLRADNTDTLFGRTANERAIAEALFELFPSPEPLSPSDVRNLLANTEVRRVLNIDAVARAAFKGSKTNGLEDVDAFAVAFVALADSRHKLLERMADAVVKMIVVDGRRYGVVEGTEYTYSPLFGLVPAAF